MQNEDGPRLMKFARIKALYKNKGSRSSGSNHCLISIMPTFSKLLEKIVNLQLHSATWNYHTMPVWFSEKWRHVCSSIKLEYKSPQSTKSRARHFGNIHWFCKSVWYHQTPIFGCKSCLYNFRQNTICWFGSYVSMRSQFIWSDGQKSASIQIYICGVPQGSILGPNLGWNL